MVVLAGLAIPNDAPQRAASVALIDYLTRPEVQIETLRQAGFFPVVDIADPSALSPGLRKMMVAVAAQSSAPDALPALLPTGLGDRGREFNAVYSAAFSRIVLRGKDIADITARQATRLRTVLAVTRAACWPPDAPSTGACPVE